MLFELWCWRRHSKSKGDQPGHLKGNQSWIFTGRTNAEAETPMLWPHDAKSWPWWPFEKTLMLGKIEGRRKRGSPTWWTWFGWTPGVGDGQGGLACCSSWGRKESDMTEWLNWVDTEKHLTNPIPIHYKDSKRTRIRGKLSQLDKEHLQETTANIILIGEKILSRKMGSKERKFSPLYCEL